MFIYSVRYLYISRGVYIFRAVFIISPRYIYSPRGLYYISHGICKYALTILNASGKIILTQMAPHINIGRVSADKASIGKLFHSGMVTCVKEYFTMGKRNSVVMDIISSIHH